ncbi:MAG: RNA polymerase sigma factor [Actinobacteria bacterium]|nr:RNA polymerase sigma factor [Actinomycetota bacterium]
MVPQPDTPKPGRTQILEELLRSHGSALSRQAHRNSARACDADDALSEACILFLRNYDGQAGVDALRWMMVVVKRCAWTLSRRANRRASREIGVFVAPRSGEQLEIEIPDAADGPDALYERREEVEQVAGVMRELKPDERTAMVLVGLGYSYREIEEMQGWSKTKINRCLVEGRARVRKSLGSGGGEKS